jgi:isopenicillin N synthase-like dioxygenase
MTVIEGLPPADIPVVDMSLLQGTPEEERGALKLLDNAFQQCGFAYISNHGISEQLLNEARSYVGFFHLS